MKGYGGNMKERFIRRVAPSLLLAIGGGLLLHNIDRGINEPITSGLGNVPTVGNDAVATPIIAPFVALGGVFFLMEGVETLIIMRSRNNSAQTLTISPEILDVTLYDGPAVKNTGGFGLGLTYRF